jgi:hypothetical protein
LELPLLLESTADLVDAVLQDEKGDVPLNALRMVYATAISRYVFFQHIRVLDVLLDVYRH